MHYQAPDPQAFFTSSTNKAKLLHFLCEKWSQDEVETPSPTRLLLGGGFKDETKSVLLTEDAITDVSNLESTQTKADTRVILHTVYSVKNEGMERVIIHANDTDIIVILTNIALAAPRRAASS